MSARAYIAGLIWAVAASAAAAQPLRVLTNPTLPPFEYKEAKKNGEELIGFDIDVGQEIGRLLKRPIQWVEVDFADIPAKLLAGEGDIAISAIRLGRERDASLTYVTYAVMEQVYLGPKARPIVKLEDLKGMNVGVLTADRARTELDVARKAHGIKRVRGFETERALLTGLSEAIIDVGVLDESRAVAAMRDSKGAWIISGHGLHREPIALAVAPTQKQLIGDLERAVKAMRAKFLPQLYDGWFGRKFPATL